MIEVLEMRVSWHIGWGNMAEVHMLLKDPPPKPDAWRLFPVVQGNYLICRQEPVVRFVFEAQTGGGALGRTVTLEDGSEYTTKGGWSSNPGAINVLRAQNEEIGEYLPYDVADVTIYGEYARPGTYNDGWGLGMAGVTFEVPWLEEQMKEHLPGVELFNLNPNPAEAKIENQGSAEQASIFASAAAYGYIPVPSDWDGTKEHLKADPESELFQRTAMPFDRQDQARRKKAS